MKAPYAEMFDGAASAVSRVTSAVRVLAGDRG